MIRLRKFVAGGGQGLGLAFMGKVTALRVHSA
jgi:hypothetical protein